VHLVDEASTGALGKTGAVLYFDTEGGGYTYLLLLIVEIAICTTYYCIGGSPCRRGMSAARATSFHGSRRGARKGKAAAVADQGEATGEEGSEGGAKVGIRTGGFWVIVIAAPSVPQPYSV
jgi:hypothetical protein